MSAIVAFLPGNRVKRVRYPSHRYQGTRPPLRNRDGVEKWTTGSTSSNTVLNGNQNRQCTNLGPSDTISIKTKPKMKEKRQKWSRQEYKEILYCFCYALENPSKRCTNERTYKLWRERNKTQREYIGTNNRRECQKEMHYIKND